MIKVSCFSQKLYSDQKMFSHVNKIFNSRKKIFLGKVALRYYQLVSPTHLLLKVKQGIFHRQFFCPFQRSKRQRRSVIKTTWPQLRLIIEGPTWNHWKKKLLNMIEEVNLVFVLDDALLVKPLPEGRHDHPRVVEPHLQEHWLVNNFLSIVVLSIAGNMFAAFDSSWC